MQNSDLKEEKAYYLSIGIYGRRGNQWTHLSQEGRSCHCSPQLFSVVNQHGGKGRVIPQRNSRQCLQQTCLQKIWNRSIVDTFWRQRFVCVSFDIHLRSYSYRENGCRGNFVERFGGKHVIYLTACEAYNLLYCQSFSPECWTQDVHRSCHQRCQPLQIKNLESFLLYLTLPVHHRTLPPNNLPWLFTIYKNILEILVGNFCSIRTARVVCRLPKISGLSCCDWLDSS